MRQSLAVACFVFFALILMDTYQVVKVPSGLTVVKSGQALAADLGRPPPPPPSTSDRTVVPRSIKLRHYPG